MVIATYCVECGKRIRPKTHLRFPYCKKCLPDGTKRREMYASYCRDYDPWAALLKAIFPRGLKRTKARRAQCTK